MNKIVDDVEGITPSVAPPTLSALPVLHTHARDSTTMDLVRVASSSVTPFEVDFLLMAWRVLSTPKIRSTRDDAVIIKVMAVGW